MNKVELLIALKDVKDYEEIIFVGGNNNYRNLKRIVRVLNKDYNLTFLIYKTYLSLDK